MRPMRGRSIRTPYMPKAAVPTVPSIFDHARGHAQLVEILGRLDAKERALDAVLARADTALDTVQEKVQSAHQAVGRLSEVHDTIRYIKGKDGDDGEDGKDADERTIINRVLDSIREPKDGETPVVDYPKIVTEVTRQVKIRDGKDAVVDYDRIFKDITQKLKVEHIPGVKAELDSFSHQLAGKKYGTDTWARGGGDTVQAGSNVTITTNADGRKVISSTGGGGGTQVYNEVVAGSGIAWTLAFTPTLGTLRLYGNGQRLTETVDYTLVGATITTVNPFSAGTLLADYSH